MGSDVVEGFAAVGDPTAQQSQGQNADNSSEIAEIFDPLDLFGTGAAGDIEAEGAAARGRVQDLMRSAESMRLNVLAKIKDRDLRASKTTANIRREALLRQGRTSTIL